MSPSQTHAVLSAPHYEERRTREEQLVMNELFPAPSERAKRLIRRLVYPSINYLSSTRIKREPFLRGVRVDKVLGSERGNDFQARRRLLNRFVALKDKTILVGGCGMGRDIPSWLPYQPAEIVGTDFDAHHAVWDRVVAACRAVAPNVRVSFRQADLATLHESFPAATFDVIASDAVFEHLRNVPASLSAMRTVVKDNGRVYAGFGPLYTCWGGDHLSGRGHILDEGFNHLLLDPASYRAYTARVIAEQRGDFEARWIEEGLLSRLKYNEYVDAFERDFVIEFQQAILSPQAMAFRDAFRAEWQRLVAAPGISEFDLCCKTMTVVLRPKRTLTTA